MDPHWTLCFVGSIYISTLIFHMHDFLCVLCLKIFYEMLELRETDLARLLLRETAVLQHLRQQSPEHFKRLDQLATRPFFDAKEVYQGMPKEKRRAAIAQGRRVISQGPVGATGGPSRAIQGAKRAT